jgi:O-antigen/teichoic acid export membrane protein
VNVALGLVLIPRLGMIGAAISALASVTLFQGLYAVQVFMAHRILPVGGSTLKPFAAAAAMLAAEWLVADRIPHPAQRIPLVIGAGVLAYLGALVALGLAPEDKRLFGKIWNRIRGRSG